METEKIIQEEQVEAIPVQEEKTKKVKKPNPVVAVIITLAAMLLFIVAQLIVGAIWGATAGTKLLVELGNDMEAYMQKIQSPEVLLILQTLSQLSAFVLLAIWYFFGYFKKTSKEDRQTAFKKVCKGKTLATVLLFGVGCYGLDVLVAQVVATLSPSSLETFNSMMSSTFGETTVLSVISIAVLAPLMEEVIFRGIGISAMKKAMPVWLAVVLSMVLFGAYHMNLMQAIYVLPIACVLGIAAIKYNSIIPCIGIHAVNNAMPFILQLLPESIAESLVTFVVLAVIGLCLGLFLNKEALFKKN